MTHHVAQAVKHAGAMLQGRRNMWVDVSPTMTQKFSGEFQEVSTQNLLEFSRIPISNVLCFSYHRIYFHLNKAFVIFISDLGGNVTFWVNATLAVPPNLKSFLKSGDPLEREPLPFQKSAFSFRNGIFIKKANLKNFE